LDNFTNAFESFFKDMLMFSLMAIFLENTIFSRAIGTSTVMYSVRKKFNIFLFGGIVTSIITASSLIAYFINPLFKDINNKYYIMPLVYVVVISIVYIIAILITTKFSKKLKKNIMSIIHISAFNCAVLGALLLSLNISNLSLGGHLGFGIGTGIGLTLASYFVDLAYERLSSERVPYAFRGFPITLIYIGIVSLAIYGLIGHELPF